MLAQSGGLVQASCPHADALQKCRLSQRRVSHVDSLSCEGEQTTFPYVARSGHERFEILSSLTHCKLHVKLVPETTATRFVMMQGVHTKAGQSTGYKETYSVTTLKVLSREDAFVFDQYAL